MSGSPIALVLIRKYPFDTGYSLLGNQAKKGGPKFCQQEQHKTQKKCPHPNDAKPFNPLSRVY